MITMSLQTTATCLYIEAGGIRAEHLAWRKEFQYTKALIVFEDRKNE